MAWDERDGALHRSFRFRDFSEAFAFLTRVAMHAEKVDHHPEFTSVWSRVTFRLTARSPPRSTGWRARPALSRRRCRPSCSCCAR